VHAAVEVRREKTPPQAVEAPMSATPPANVPLRRSIDSLADESASVRRADTAFDSREATAESSDATPRVQAPERTAPRRSALLARSTDALAAEIALVRKARAALDAGDARAALGLSTQHSARFPGGVLAQEAAVIRVLALCEMGRAAEAGAIARHLEQTSKRSPHLDRLRGSCARAALSSDE
jgi:hypothetical protein